MQRTDDNKISFQKRENYCAGDSRGDGCIWGGLTLDITRRDFAKITWSTNGVEHGVFKRGGGSYLSSCDPRDVLGLGQAEYTDWIQGPAAIRRTDRFEHVRAGKYYSLAPGGKLL